MGAEPYWYFTKYQRDVDGALQKLRQREFAAGRYNPVTPFLRFPIDPGSSGPGAQHDSIEEAMEDAAEDGTRSILDLMSVGDEPNFCVAARMSDDELLSRYGTTQPTRAMIEADLPLDDDVERGHGVCIIVYKNGQPDEIFFGGYSFD
jgi:hypothetical protein